MINEIIDFSKTSITEDSKYKFYQDILDKEELIKENYKLMQLYVPNLSTLQSRKIKESIENFVPEFNQSEVMRLILKDGFSDYSWDSLFQLFKSFSFPVKKVID